MSLAADAGNTFATVGFMAIALPLAEVTAERFTALGDPLVETTRGAERW